MGDELRAGLYSSFNLCRSGPGAQRVHTDKSLARPVTNRHRRRGLMASQMALLFARRLHVPVVLTDIDQARVDKGVGYVHGEVDKAAGPQATLPR